MGKRPSLSRSELSRFVGTYRGRLRAACSPSRCRAGARPDRAGTGDRRRRAAPPPARRRARAPRPAPEARTGCRRARARRARTGRLLAGRRAGAFRADLLARLAGYRHVLLPLRARREDLGLILGDLLRRAEIPGADELRFGTAAGRRLLAYDWPLNIRELQQCVSVAAALARRTT